MIIARRLPLVALLGLQLGPLVVQALLGAYLLGVLRRVEVEAGELVLRAARQEGHLLVHPCGGGGAAVRGVSGGGGGGEGGCRGGWRWWSSSLRLAARVGRASRRGWDERETRQPSSDTL